MRICRVAVGDELFFGVLEGLDAQGEPGEGTVIALLEGHPFGEIVPDGRLVRFEDVRLVAPVLPSKVVAIGKNYLDHIREVGLGEAPPEPLMFLKPSTAVVGPGDPIELPWQSEHVEHEAELAIVIGRVCREVPRERVAEVILGYTCANDVTARDLQTRDGQWARAKGFDSFCPLGPWIETDFAWEDRAIRCTVNDELRQDGTTNDMLFDVATVVEAVSAVMTLLPGDVILTGSPSGTKPIKAGDSVTVRIDGIGSLTNPVVDRA
ncbi:MAG: fumarylacetoacetate hydrolase family protein [Candidatus Nanopelagicales bacterium]|nr:fumarylacetoacetate hydrolase family protein [Candidatus Nanopelagicales bacterium]